MPSRSRAAFVTGPKAREVAAEPLPAVRAHTTHLMHIARALELLKDADYPCWQMTFEDIYRGWSVGISRHEAAPEAEEGQRQSPVFRWTALDGQGIYLDGSGEAYRVPEAAWNAAVNAILAFLRSVMVFPTHPIPKPEAAPGPSLAYPKLE